MANIFTSSIGKKLIMSITGAFLVLFLTFHLVMNSTLLISDEAYDSIVKFLGANWYAMIGTTYLAVGALLHFVFAFILALQNRKARGKIRYAEAKKEPGVEWASKNMLILGFVVLGGLLLHLYNFWYNMQWPELMGEHINSLGTTPQDGAAMVKGLFAQPVYVAIYLIWLVGLGLHLTHGMWSMFQSIGWNSKVWFKRLKVLTYILAISLAGGFAVIVIMLYIQSLM